MHLSIHLNASPQSECVRNHLSLLSNLCIQFEWDRNRSEPYFQSFSIHASRQTSIWINPQLPKKPFQSVCPFQIKPRFTQKVFSICAWIQTSVRMNPNPFFYPFHSVSSIWKKFRGSGGIGSDTHAHTCPQKYPMLKCYPRHIKSKSYLHLQLWSTYNWLEDRLLTVSLASDLDCWWSFENTLPTQNA